MIIFKKVWKSYPKELFSATTSNVLEGVSFHVNKAETLGLVGPNGAGKSTSIRLLMDFIRPDKGEINLMGQNSKSLKQRSEIGYLPEVATFQPNLNLVDMIKFVGKTCGLEKYTIQKRSESLLDKLGLWSVRKKRFLTYSKGMQQRANFILALLNDPKLLVLDEPMSGLDPMGRKTITDLIFQLKDDGKTILFCSHILEDVDRLADNILVLHKGKTLFLGKPNDLRNEESKDNTPDAFVARILREGACG